MKVKKFLHVFAILFSSLISMLSYGHAKPELAKKAKKGSESELSKEADESAGSSADAAEDPPKRTGPPLKIDPALMASAEQSTPIQINSLLTKMPAAGE